MWLFHLTTSLGLGGLWWIHLHYWWPGLLAGRLFLLHVLPPSRRLCHPHVAVCVQEGGSEIARVLEEEAPKCRTSLTSHMPRLKRWGIRFQFLWEEQQNHIAKGRAYRQWEHCCGPFANKLTQKLSDFCSRRWSLLGGIFLRDWRGVQRCSVAQRVTKCSLQLAYSWVGWLWPPFLCPGTSGAIDLLGGLLSVSSLMGSWPGGDRAWPCDQSGPDWRHHRY